VSGIGTVLVTGGAGFIGCAISQRYAAEAGRWVVLDSLHPQVHATADRPAALHPSAELMVGDVTDPGAWDTLLETISPDVIIHLAAETGTAQSLYEATRHAQVNVVGTTVMLDALGRAGMVPGHFLLSSSRAVYGEGQWRDSSGALLNPGPRSHARLAKAEWDYPDAVAVPSSAVTTPAEPSSVYGATKLAQEHLLSAWTRSHDTALTILRLQNVYGPGQSLTNSYTGIVSLFSQLAMKAESIPIYEDGMILRDFIFIDDIADAFVAAMTDVIAGGFRRYDVGSGIGTTILDLAGTIARYHDAPEPHITGAFRDGDVRAAACRIDATIDALDWEPRWSVEDGVARLQEWISAQE
jgi:dTDP-L-rhamnose 4-epimerase